LALIASIASGAAVADEPFAGPAAVRAASLYLEIPLGVRDRQRAKPSFGLRVEELSSPARSFAGATGLPKTLVDVPLRVRHDDAVRDSGAAMLLGKGAIVGIVVGAVVAVALISDDDDGGGY
jgi:hypothetical protein